MKIFKNIYDEHRLTAQFSHDENADKYYDQGLDDYVKENNVPAALVTQVSAAAFDMPWLSVLTQCCRCAFCAD